MYLLVAYGIAITGISLALLLRTERVIDLGIRYCQWRYMHPAEILINAGFGTLFLYFAEEAKFPLMFRIFGGMLLAIGLGLMFVPPHHHRRYGLWSIEKCRRLLRPAALVSLIFGALVIYSAI